jgi:hypothetical protein
MENTFVMRSLKASPIPGLRRILRDQYDSRSILKELIQNADDAKATQFHIGWMSDWPANLHPLLDSPAIVVLNDGEFKQGDAKAICCIDVGTKGGDSHAIGKFGLGMKSVFHLCEAFFFLASDNQKGSQNSIELLNPWYDGSEDSFHYDWGNNLTAVNSHIAERINSWNHGCDRWFCLILPLRSEQQLNGTAPIIRRYPNIKEFFTPDLPRQIASLMPMLRYLESLTIWYGKNLSQKETIETDGKTRVPCSFPLMEAGTAKTIRGKTLDSVSMAFGGKEILLDERVFQRLKFDNRWPASESFDKETGESSVKPESAEPHCAAVFSCIPADDGKGCLTIKHAVFLPLAKELCRVSCEGDIEFQLLLHGYFFLDAGRKEIISATDGRLESKWNEELISKGVYPLILPALKEFADFSGLDPEQIHNLTKAIYKSSFYNDNRRHICSKDQWIWRIFQNENTWQLLSADEEFFKLPAPPDDSPNLPFKVFPNLGKLCQNHNITYQNEAYLSSKGPVNWSRNSSLLTDLLKSLEIAAFTDEHLLSYLIKFLRQESLLNDAKLLLVAHARRAIKEHGLTTIRIHAEKFKEFVMLLGNNHWVSFSTTGISGRLADAIFKELLAIDLSRLLLPDDLSPDHTGYLSLDEADKILSKLARMDRVSMSAKSIFALQVVEKTRASLGDKRSKLGGYSVFLCKSYADKSKQLFNWNKLHELKQHQQLFVGHSSFAEPLQGAIHGLDIFRLVEVGNLKPFQILFSSENPPSFDKSACFNILGKIPSLNAPENRSDLFQNLQGCPEKIGFNDYLKAMRYLLHGSKEHYHDTKSSLLRTPRMQHDKLLNKLARSAMVELGDEWRWLQHEKLIRNLSDAIAHDLNIKHIDFNAIEELLKETWQIGDLTWLSDIGLSEDEKKILLGKIQDKEIWRSLPLHKTIDGQYVSIDNSNCYYQAENFNLPSSLEGIVTIISRMAELNEKYNVNVLPAWNPETMLEAVCKQEKPDRFWAEILDALNSLQSEPPEQLKSTRWIPTTSGAKSPEKIIYLPEIENELTRLLADPELDGAFFSVEHIKNQVKDSPGFSIVKEKLFPSRNAALKMLGECLSDIEKYYIGELEIPNKKPSHLILKAFKGVSSEILPVYELLRALLANFRDEPAIEEYLLPNLLQPIAIERTISCLDFLSNRHEQASEETDREIIFTVHCCYLRSFAESDGNSLGEIRLLNRKGQWRSPNRLCFDAQGIDEAYLLHLDQGEILSKIVSHNNIQPDPRRNRNYMQDTIEEYFERWEGLLPNQVIGGFLALLGSDYNELAQGYLQHLNIKNFREQIGVIRPGIPTLRRRLSFRFRSSGNNYPVMNLTGNRFYPPVSETYQNIFIGNFANNEITIREFEPENHTGEELTDILFESASLLISKIYCVTPLNLKAVWDDLSLSSQLELEVVQGHILRNAFLYFKQLGGVHLSSLQNTIQSWKNLDRQRVEAEHYQKDIEDIEGQLRELNEKLKYAIESDPDIQTETLEAVRQKMEKDFQYSLKSILFELFQNSDDAALELSEMVEDAARLPLVDQVSLIWDEDRLVWIHWGRQINEFRRGKISSEAGRKLGYDADLENMLFLSSSDKGFRRGKVTGKYGLGFKSVFLLTDNPKVLSGQLGFEVVGGFYPKRLSDEERQRLRDVLNSNSNSRQNIGTLFELAGANEDKIRVMREMIKKFDHLVPILLIFARKIKQCKLPQKDITWHETPVPQCNNVFTGKVQLSNDESKEPVNVVVLRGENHSALLMAVGTAVFEKLPDDIPTFWVTAPTTEKLKTGFAVNGPFALDIGRAQLAGDILQNDETARQLGADFRSALIEMFNSASHNWSKFCNALGLVENNTSPYQLWYSLWELLSKGVPYERGENRSAAELLKRIFWENNLGMQGFLQTKKALPTGLPGRYQGLTHPDNVFYMAQGIIDEKPEIFSAISAWPNFSHKVKSGKIISSSKIGSVMKRLRPSILDWRPLKLRNIIEWELDRINEVSFETSNRLGELINRTFLDELEKDTVNIRNEGRELKSYLKDLRFKSLNDEYQIVKDLLAKASEKDEEEDLRAAFAPDDRVLNSGYAPSGILFFKACRPKMDAPSNLLLQWGKEAETKDKRYHFLQYLLKGELAKGVSDLLIKGGRPEWLQNLRNSSYLDNYEGHERLILSGRLGFQSEISKSESGEKLEVFTIKSPSHIIEKIFEWWETHYQREISKYEARVYVQGQFPNINEDVPDNPAERKEWLKLFLYGILHSIGRTAYEANRNFVRLCENHGWLSLLANSDRPHDWLKVWDEYIEEQIQGIKFFHWMKQLIGLFLVARRLDDYVEAFLAVNQINGTFSLKQITATRASELFQGGGPDAPPISNVLGIGAWFIMRELVRKGIIKNKNAHRHCYVPMKRVRDLVERMGGPSLENFSREEQSIRIYRFLADHLGEENATFNGAFDIPLQLIAQDDELWNEFFTEARPEFEDED